MKVMKVKLIGIDGWEREVYQDKNGGLWKYAEPGASPRERHERLYDTDEIDGEPGWPLDDEIDYEIVENFK